MILATWVKCEPKPESKNVPLPVNKAWSREEKESREDLEKRDVFSPHFSLCSKPNNSRFQSKAKQIKNPKLEGGHGTAVQKSYTVYLIHYIPISQVGDALEIQTLKEGHSMLLQMWSLYLSLKNY